MTLPDHVARFVAMKQKLGYQFTTNARILSSFARFAADREEACIRSETVLEWAATAASQPRIVRKLHTVHAFACWMHAEDSRHEVPPRHAFGRLSCRRPQPHQVSVRDIRRLLEAALGMPPADSITPLTWHGLFGLMASTGLRISEALALQLSDVTRDGLVIRETKFRKSRMVALHSTVRDALDRYLAARRTQRTPDGHLFVLATGRPPSSRRATAAFRKLAEQTGLRAPGGARGPTPHSLRHAFAVRSLETLGPDADPSRHMLALATYPGHASASGTYWYLQATPVLLRGIAEAAEQAHKKGASHD